MTTNAYELNAAINNHPTDAETTLDMLLASMAKVDEVIAAIQSGEVTTYGMYTTEGIRSGIIAAAKAAQVIIKNLLRKLKMFLNEITGKYTRMEALLGMAGSKIRATYPDRSGVLTLKDVETGKILPISGATSISLLQSPNVVHSYVQSIALQMSQYSNIVHGFLMGCKSAIEDGQTFKIPELKEAVMVDVANGTGVVHNAHVSMTVEPTEGSVAVLTYTHHPMFKASKSVLDVGIRDVLDHISIALSVISANSKALRGDVTEDMVSGVYDGIIAKLNASDIEGEVQSNIIGFLKDVAVNYTQSKRNSSDAIADYLESVRYLTNKVLAEM